MLAVSVPLAPAARTESLLSFLSPGRLPAHYSENNIFIKYADLAIFNVLISSVVKEAAVSENL